MGSSFFETINGMVGVVEVAAFWVLNSSGVGAGTGILEEKGTVLGL